MTGAKVALLGVGELGLPIASSLVHAGFDVHGFDVSVSALQALNSVLKTRNSSFAEASRDAAFLLVTTSSREVVGNLGLVTDSALSALSHGAVVLLCSMVPLSCVSNLKQLLSEERNDLLVVDAPVSQKLDGGIKVVVSGNDDAKLGAQSVLLALCKDYVVANGGLGASSKLNLVNNALVGVHLAAAAEAIALGACCGLDTRVLYNIISNAAGSSNVFAKIVPRILSSEDKPAATLDQVAQHLAVVLEEAKELRFPLPLTAAAHQQVILGCASGHGQEDCAAVVKIWERSGIHIGAPMNGNSLNTMDGLANLVSNVKHVAFIGLGAMGFGMATNLLRKGFIVNGFDVYEPSMCRFVEAGGKSSQSPEDAVQGVDVLILMVTNENQVETVLYGHQGALKSLIQGSTVVLCSTVSPEFVRKLAARLAAEDRNLHVVDAPVSGGVARAANGTLTIMAAASMEALKHVGSVLSAMSEKLYVLEGGVGVGSSVKMVNQHLAGVHIAASAEAMALGARLGLETRFLYDFIATNEGSSWMFVNRVPHMLDSDYTPLSALDIFVKDLGIVFGESKRVQVPIPLASCAHQQFLLGSAAGWGRLDDSAVVKVFENMASVSVVAKLLPISNLCKSSNRFGEVPSVSKDIALNSLLPEWPKDVLTEIRQYKEEGVGKVLIVLDDDATGTQTVNGVTVLTAWDIDLLTEELKAAPACLFILTNSRAFSGEEAVLLTKTICQNVMIAAAAAGNVGYTIVLRGDSTLRGHFPEEADAATSVLGNSHAWIICPFFSRGGRYTINDIHYVADGNMLIPAGQTEFAQDSIFGYVSSNLCEWVEEKMKGRVVAKDIVSVSIETIRKGGPEAVCQQLCGLKKGTICIVNSASEKDIQVFAAGMILAEARGKTFLCRTAAEFVSARLGLEPKAPKPSDLGPMGTTGGLIVVGSYVPRTTAQIEETKKVLDGQLKCITVNVAALTSDMPSTRENEINLTARIADLSLASGRDTLIMTSRTLMKGASVTENIKIGSNISSALVEIVSRIQTRPRYLLAKGGITSSDLASKAMKSRKAQVVGQVLPGVPLWVLGLGSRHPGLPYIVFPGNVGDSDAVSQVIRMWSKPSHQSTKELLAAAECGGYAVGAFNVYNLEGIQAVVAAAEAEQSPAILQLHPAALTNGGQPLVASCLAAAKLARVPLTVHLDHGTDEKHLVEAFELGFDSIMVDGSSLPFRENIQFTKHIVEAAHAKKIVVEAELGRLAGTEDGLTVEEYQTQLTDVDQADEFLKETHVDFLAICIGNIHGKYPPSGPSLDLTLLKKLQIIAGRHNTKLVLHGASGVPADLIKACIDRGVSKFNVNTEVRRAYMKSMQTPHIDLVELLESSKQAMKDVIVEKLRLFGSSGKAKNVVNT